MGLDEATLVGNLKLLIDKSGFKRDLENLGKEAEIILGTKGRTVDSGGGSNGLAGLGKSLKSVMMMLGKVGIVISVLPALMKLLSPVSKILTQIFNVIGEFLRPISDVLVIALQPILAMLRPILQVFRALMAPFRQLAFQGLAAANRLLAEGAQQTLAGNAGLGAELTQKGFAGILSSAGLMLSGFTRVLLTPLTEVFPLLEAGFDKWEAASIKGITKAIILSDTIAALKPVMGDTESAITTALGLIDEQMQVVKKNVDDWNIENATNILNTAKDSVDLMATGVGAALGGEDGVTSILEDLEEQAKLLDVPMGAVVQRVAMAIPRTKAFAEAIKELTSNLSEGTMLMAFEELVSDITAARPSLGGAIMGGFKAGAGGKPPGILGAFGGAIGIGGAISDFISGNALENWAEESQSLIEDFKKNWGVTSKKIEETNKGFLDDIYSHTQKNMGEEGKTIKVYKGGMTTMSKSTKDFADETKRTASIVQSAVENMKMWATRYFNALNDIARLETSSRTLRAKR